MSLRFPFIIIFIFALARFFGFGSEAPFFSLLGWAVWRFDRSSGLFFSFFIGTFAALFSDLFHLFGGSLLYSMASLALFPLKRLSFYQAVYALPFFAAAATLVVLGLEMLYLRFHFLIKIEKSFLVDMLAQNMLIAICVTLLALLLEWVIGQCLQRAHRV